MDLVNEYLRAVGVLLPRAQREDIVAELREAIVGRIEARAAEFRRPLTDAETEALLREFGHPLVVAARYRDGPQHVVGPALYPYWMFAVKIALAIQLFIVAIVFVIRTITSSDIAEAFGRAVGAGVGGAITIVGLATVAAWIVERQRLRLEYFDQWRVRDLRVLDFAAWDLASLREAVAAHGWRPVRRQWASGVRWSRRSLIGRALGAIAAGTVLVLWWLGVLRFGLVGSAAELRELNLDPGALAGVDWAGVKQVLFWPVLGYGLAVIAQGAVMLARPRGMWLVGLFDAALGGAQIALAAWLWTASPLASAIDVDSLTGLAVRLKSAFQHYPPMALAPQVTLCVGFMALIGLAQVLRGLWEIVAPPPAMTEAAPTGS